MKVVIADPKEGICYQVELDEIKSKPFYGLKIGNEIEGSLVGVAGYKLEITGGTDKDGFPMRRDVHGTERKRSLLRGKPGFRAKKKGEKKRKTIRGNVIAEDVAQINVKVLEYGSKKLSEIFGVKKEEKAEDKPIEEVKKTEEKKPEAPKEEKPVEKVKEEPKEEKEEKELKEPVKEEVKRTEEKNEEKQ